MKTDYYKRQINGLILILKQADSEGDFMVARSYIAEKLKMILNGGIGFHPSILEKLEKITNHSHESDPRGEGGKILIKTLNPPTSLSELNPKGGKIWKHK